jgi:hypothetical protein
MISKTCQTKSMPVPHKHTVKNDPDHFGFDSIDKRMSEDTALQEEQKYPDMGYLDQGNTGMAYVHKDIVVKYTPLESEAKAAEYIQVQQPPCVVQIYEVRQVQENPPLWAILAEKVKPLSKNEKISMELEDDREMNNRIDEMTLCLHEHGLSDNDVHNGNVGWRGDDLVLLDVGGSYHG